jgi:hypothetical protein
MTVTPERLAAYADGELDAIEAAAIAAEIARNPDLQAQLAAHLALRAKLASHFAPVAAEPVPARLRDLLEAPPPAAGDVVDLAAARGRVRSPVRSLPRWALWAGPALAASLVLGLFAVLPGGDDGYAQGALAGALDAQLAEAPPAGGDIRILLSFRDRSGRFCRGYAQGAGAGVACRDARGWRLHGTHEGSAATTGDYRQAGSAAEALMAQVQDMAEGPALDAAQERAAQARGWR